MTIAITSSGISLDGPLVAGEKVAVTVSGLALAAEDKPTLALLARFPDALLASVELAEDAQTPGTWTGELDTATKQTALFFATARADERRDAALELVSGRVSLARLTVPMANSALCPKPDGSPFASPVYVPVPGPPGTGGDPYDQNPAMDGAAAPGVAEEYARGDHVHPTDNTRASTTALSEGLAAKQDTIADLAAIRSGSAAGATAVQPADLAAVATTGDYADLLNKPAIPAAQIQSDWNQTNSAAVDFIKNKPTIPGPAPVTSVNGETGDVAIYGNTLVMSSSDSTLVSEAINSAQSDATTALSDVSAKATATALAPAFSTSSTYAVGDYCTYQGLLYKCTTAVTTAGAWNAANWTAVAVTDEMGGGGEVNVIDTVKVNGVALTPDANKAVNIVKKVWSATCTYTTNTSFSATPEGSDFSLANGDVVIFVAPTYCEASPKINVGGSGAINIISAAAYTYYNVEKNAWHTGDVVVLQYSQSKAKWVLLGAKKANVDSPAFTGTPTAPTAASGTNTTQIATTAFVQSEARYALASPTASVSGTAATVACEDRAINDFTVATGITSLTITPPAAVTGRARDFFCRVTLTDSSLPTVTLSAGQTVDIGQSEINGMTQGVNLLMFTEIASGHWLASRRSAS